MDAPIELLTFVTRAENRITPLRALENGPQTRFELEAATDIPRATPAGSWQTAGTLIW